MKLELLAAVLPLMMSGVAFAAPAQKADAKDPVACSETKGCKECSGKSGHCGTKCTCDKGCECPDCGCEHAKKKDK